MPKATPSSGCITATLSPKTFAQLQAILAKQLYFEASRGGVMFSTAEEVLTHLLDDKFSSEVFFKAQAAATCLADYRPQRLALIDLGQYRSLNFGDDALKNQLNYVFYASHPFLYRGSVLLFLSDGHDLTQFDDLARQFHLRVVVSDVLDRLYHLPRYYRAADEVMQYLRAHTAGSWVARVEQFHDLMLLRQLQGRTDLIHPQIRALFDYDHQYHTQYCRTLYTYCISHHSVKQTCAQLFTHRNTVLYRLRKMKEEFDLPLDDPSQALALLLSAALVLLWDHQDQLFVRGFQLAPSPAAGARQS